MTPLPKRRHSRRRQGKRRQAIKLNSAIGQNCPQCGAPKKPHLVCSNCGYYNGKIIIAKKEKKSKTKKV
ncbi:50S ribosomal protein L32 [Candidatus Microgenomates bacterium]|nr:50S ribosomal protein L32 [Candidatus Microgenomates bacterium]